MSAGSRRRRLAVVPVAVLLALLVTACGSRVDPATVAALEGSGGSEVGAVDGSVPGDGAVDPVTGEAPSGDLPGAAPGGEVPAAPGGPTGSGSGGSGGGGGTPGGGSGDGAPGGGARAASCDGFTNGRGITDSTITIGNASDVSGPVPGIFESAQVATRAYVAFFNATSDICGRKLALKTYDVRTDAGGDQQAYTDACNSVFAMVGSMSAFDSGGAQAAQGCGLPDVRSAMVTLARQACRTCFGAQSTMAGEVNNAVPDYVLKEFPEAGRNGAMLFINAGAAAENGRLQAEALRKRGMRMTYVQGIDVSEFNYAPFVQRMKDLGVRYVQMIGQPPQFVRLAQAMQQQGFKPDVLMFDPSAYESEFVQRGGSAVEGATVFTNFTPFEEAARNEEMARYLAWLRQTKPGAEPDFFGVFAWSAARLFVERATALGGRLSRQTLVAELNRVDQWTANGLHSPQRPGPRRTGECFRFLQLRGGTWVPIGGNRYRCNGTTNAG